jgi:hypothetical protein
MRESRKLKTRWRRGWDSNPRATFAAAGFQESLFLADGPTGGFFATAGSEPW